MLIHTGVTPILVFAFLKRCFIFFFWVFLNFSKYMYTQNNIIKYALQADHTFTDNTSFPEQSDWLRTAPCRTDRHPLKSTRAQLGLCPPYSTGECSQLLSEVETSKLPLQSTQIRVIIYTRQPFFLCFLLGVQSRPHSASEHLIPAAAPPLPTIDFSPSGKDWTHGRGNAWEEPLSHSPRSVLICNLWEQDKIASLLRRKIINVVHWTQLFLPVRYSPRESYCVQHKQTWELRSWNVLNKTWWQLMLVELEYYSFVNIT